MKDKKLISVIYSLRAPRREIGRATSGSGRREAYGSFGGGGIWRGAENRTVAKMSNFSSIRAFSGEVTQTEVVREVEIWLLTKIGGIWSTEAAATLR